MNNCYGKLNNKESKMSNDYLWLRRILFCLIFPVYLSVAIFVSVLSVAIFIVEPKDAKELFDGVWTEPWHKLFGKNNK